MKWLRYALSPWSFFFWTLIVGLLFLSAMRVNNATMVQLRDQVYAADKNDGDVQTALTNLQRYVTAHMNTDLTSGKDAIYPPIQLKYTYERLQAAANDQSGSEQIYNDAQKYCESLNSTDFSGRNRVPCIQQYVSSHGATTVPKTIPDSLYKFDFVSPSWSPDLAGWSLVGTIVLFICGLVSLAARLLHRRRPRSA